MLNKAEISNFTNVFLTNFCNQNCSFCYAKKLMANKDINKEMLIEEFKQLIYKLKNYGCNIKLLGGEPTLHTQFEQIITLLVANFKTIQVFTNGLYSEKIQTLIKQHRTKVHLTFNICTPGFQFDTKLRNLIIKRIKELSLITVLTLSIIINPNNLSKSIVSLLDKKTLKNVAFIRLGLLNPIVGGKNYYSLEEFPKIGGVVINTVKKLLRLQPKLNFIFDCGFTRCMFTNNQFQFLNQVKTHCYYLGCFLGRFQGHFDVQSDLKTVSCYSLSNENITNLKYDSVKKTQEKIFLKQYLNQDKLLLEKCKKCKFRESIYHQCAGPCLGLKMNLISIQNALT